MKIFYTDHFTFPLRGREHFPIEKYALLRQHVSAAGIIKPEGWCVPAPAKDEEILRVHEKSYFDRVVSGKLTRKEVLRIGLPWSRALVVRCRRSCGATIEACRNALTDGISLSLAGGSHHAFPDRGEGYCLFNDCAVAARALQFEGPVKRVLIIDCDVHQGNGTAAVFRDDPTVFTFSIHGERNFPFHKEESDLDIPLKDNTGDKAYLAALDAGLKRSLKKARADFAIYIAGADPYVDDRYGRLSLSQAGLAERDRMVFQHLGESGLPVAVTMGGGYARKILETVRIQLQTVRLAASHARERETQSG